MLDSEYPWLIWFTQWLLITWLLALSKFDMAFIVPMHRNKLNITCITRSSPNTWSHYKVNHNMIMHNNVKCWQNMSLWSLFMWTACYRYHFHGNVFFYCFFFYDFTMDSIGCMCSSSTQCHLKHLNHIQSTVINNTRYLILTGLNLYMYRDRMRFMFKGVRQRALL